MSNLSVLQLFENKTVRVDEEGLICLTDLFKVATEKGLADGKQNPYEWSRPQRSVKSGSTGKIDDVVSGGRQFIDFIAKNLNTAATQVYKTTRGKGGGTYAHWQIALAYAKYLSPELHMRVNETYMRVQSGDVSIAVEVFERQDGGTWVHPIVFFDMAMWYSAEVKIKVIKWAINKGIVKREITGTLEQAAIALFDANRDYFRSQDEAARYIEDATKHESQLAMRDRIHDNIVLLADVMPSVPDCVNAAIEKAKKALIPKVV